MSAPGGTIEAPVRPGPTKGPEGEGGPASPDKQRKSVAERLKLTKAKEMASKLRGIWHKDKGTPNPEGALQTAAETGEKKRTKSENWKKVTARNARRLGQRQFGEKAMAWQDDPVHGKDVKERFDALKAAKLKELGDGAELSLRDRFKLRGEAIYQSMEAKGVDPRAKDKKGKADDDVDRDTVVLRSKKEVKDDPDFKAEVGRRLDIQAAQGLSTGKWAEAKVRRQVLRDTQDAERATAEQQVRDRQDIRKSDEYRSAYTEEFKTLFPKDREVSNDEAAEISATAKRNVMERMLQEKRAAIEVKAKAKEQERQAEADQRQRDEAEVKASGEFQLKLASLLFDKKNRDNPDIQTIAMNEAIGDMKKRKKEEEDAKAAAAEAAAGKPAAEAGEPSAGGGTATGTEGGSASGAEASADADPATPESAAAKMAAEALTAMLKTKEGQASILAMYKRLNGGKDVDLTTIDKSKDPIWLQILAFFGTALWTVMKSIGSAGAEGLVDAATTATGGS